MTKRFLPLGTAAAIVAAGILSAGTAGAARSAVPAVAYKLSADLTPAQVVPAVQAPTAAKGRYEAILVRSGVGTSRLVARGLVGCKVFAPPRQSGLPTRIVCGGRLAVSVPRGPGIHWRLGWRLTVSDLSGPAVAARVHIAAKGHAAPAAFSLCGPCSVVVRGSTAVTAGQAAALLNGNAYVDVSTAAHPDGEIRGQIVRFAR